MNITAPTLSDGAAPDQIISVDDGTWSGSPTINYSYQWKRCDPDGGDCTDIPGQTESDYIPTRDDVGLTLVAWVTATNGWGDMSADTAPSDVVIAPAPLANISPPQIYTGPHTAIRYGTGPANGKALQP